MVAFSFSADKYRPISWSANHVTLYNVQNNKPEIRSESPNMSRSSSQRRGTPGALEQPKEEQMRQIK